MLLRVRALTFLPEFQQSFDPPRFHVPKLAFMQFPNGLVQFLQRGQSFRVMRVLITRRSSFWRSRVISPRFSMRSSKRVMSGS